MARSALNEPQAVGVVADFFTAAIDRLAVCRDELAADIGKARSSGRLTTARLDDVVEPYANRCFAADPVPVYGAGFIAALDLLADASSYLSWWQGAERTKLALATQSVNKQSIDYSDLEWYRVPMQTREPHLVGPYVDYLCSDEYTMTAAVPVHLGEEFVGVLAVDLLVDNVERRLTPLLETGGDKITVINGVGRVVVSTDPRIATGSSLRRDAHLQSMRRFDCPGVPLGLLVA